MRTYIQQPKGHVWAVHGGGDLDIFAFYEGEYCNGPRCINCGYGFCHHCEDGPKQECNASGKEKTRE